MDGSPNTIPLVSEYRDSIDVLLRARFLDPPSHPGLLACLDRFEILRVVGVGGMGVVVLAREAAGIKAPSSPAPQGETRSLERPRLFAIKMLKPELAASVRAAQQFVNEVRHMECLAHPHILPVLEVSEQSQRAQIRMPNDKGGQATCPVLKAKRPYYVMPYVEEGSLAAMIRSKGPMAEASIATVAGQMASALAYVHDKGITHRDLNPSNILVDGQGRAYLTDFGLSRTVFNDPLTDARREQRVGTTPYMSPAVAMGEAEDTRCDIYAFGAVLYEMLTGKPPYTGADAAAVIQQIVSGPPRPILSINPGASRRLAQIAEGAMGRNLRERYARMADVVSDLERVKNGKKPLGPRSLSAGSSHGTWKERRHSLLRKYLAGACAAIAIAAFGWHWLQSRRPALEMVQTIRAPGIYRWDDARIGDWNGDKHQELFLASNGELTIVNELGPLLRAPAVAGDYRRMALDLVLPEAQDRGDEAYLSWISPAGAVIGVFDRDSIKNRAPLKQFVVDKHPQTESFKSIVSIAARKVVDLKGDGSKQVLAILTFEEPLKTCWLYCFDRDSTRLNWTYPLGAWDAAIECGDIDGDGAREVLAGYREADGSSGGILALNSQGVLLWKTQTGGSSERCSPVLADLNGERKLDVLAWTAPVAEPAGAQPLPSKILRLDGGGKIIAAYSSSSTLCGCIGAVLDGGKKACVLATDQEGFLHRLDEGLRLEEKKRIVRKKFDAVDLRILDVVTLGKSGRPQIVLSSAQCQNMPVPNALRRADSPSVTSFNNVSVHLVDALLNEVASAELMPWSKDRRHLGFFVSDWYVGGDPILVCCGDAAWLLRLRNGQK